MGLPAMADLPPVGRPVVTHQPVLLHEVRDALAPAPGQLLVDATVGQGGHAEMLLEATGPSGRLLALDRDPRALHAAKKRLARFGSRVTLVHADFRSLATVMAEWSEGPVDGILADLGIGSHQLEDPDRGFSFRAEGPLDMRLDRDEPGPTAADLVNRLSEDRLRDIFRRYGEEPAPRRVARAIVRARADAPIESTTRLAGILARSAGRRRGETIHPATRVFLALRIAVNRELDGLDRFLLEAVFHLRPGGRLAVISFHSLEDRIVKHTLRELAHRCHCPRDLPVCACGQEDLIDLPRKRPVRPGTEETLANPRARSARLRWGARR
jgi:16S rRNA (cytosine1402-N4)-methyltransferase